VTSRPTAHHAPTAAHIGHLHDRISFRPRSLKTVWADIDRFTSSARVRPWSCSSTVCVRRRRAPNLIQGAEDAVEIEALRLPVRDAFLGVTGRCGADQDLESQASPSCAINCWRFFGDASEKKKLTTCSGWLVNWRAAPGSCVHTPDWHVFKWHLRIMMQPSATTSGAVAKPNLSAPRAHVMITAAAGLIWLPPHRHAAQLV
jgi:hypothetical protein